MLDAFGDGPVAATAAYLHVPFCFHKCHYCDFYSFVEPEGDDRQEAFVERIEEELQTVSQRLTGSLASVFIGGGTPTLLRAPLLARMLEAVRTYLPLQDNAEWTVECNPETIDLTTARILFDSGVNRASVGCQSFQPAQLKMLERQHDPANVKRAVDHLRSVGLNAINLDLIFGVPGSTLASWSDDLAQAIALEPEHLSCYGLQYEPNTPLTKKLNLGRLERLDDEIEARQFEHTCARLSEAGFAHYEISNFALPNGASRHNLAYWRNENWLAFGPSAAGHLDGTRWRNVARLGTWLAHRPWAPVQDLERLGGSKRAGERLMMGLRLRCGMTRAELETILAPNDERWFTLHRAVGDGLMEWRSDCLRFTDSGILLADTVLIDLID